MTTVQKFWSFSTLPQEAIDNLLTVLIADQWSKDVTFVASGDIDLLSHTNKARISLESKTGGVSLFDLLGVDEDGEMQTIDKGNNDSPAVLTHRVIWATDSYEPLGSSYDFHAPLHDLNVVQPRVEKSIEEQKSRSKKKAEVFTPTWIVNIQNNSIDNNIINGFNNVDNSDIKEWEPLGEKIFKDERKAIDYLMSPRLEMCCGEGPYLFTPYDASTGISIPVLNTDGTFARVGLFDRKMRIVHELSTDIEAWIYLAEIALRSTYGFEWQGDNLLLARLNMINSYFDYLQAFCLDKSIEMPSSLNLKKMAINTSLIASQQIWQMDGVKGVVPLSCSDKCLSCKKKLYHGHDGIQPVIKWNHWVNENKAIYRIFDNFTISVDG